MTPIVATDEEAASLPSARLPVVKETGLEVRDLNVVPVL